MTLPGVAAASQALAALLEERTGQQISAARTWRIESALRPLMRELGLSNLSALAIAAAKGDERLATRITELLLNNETSFFRDMAVFDSFDRTALAALADARRATKGLRLWSAGCSTGQEAYTLAMLLRDGGPRWAGWTIDILATDISASAIGRARRGHYSQFEIQRGLPVRTMLRWFRQDEEEWIVDPAIKNMVRFGVHNLLDPPPGRFDAILCRNVLMYFQPKARAQVFARLAAALEQGGVLMLGAGETVIGQTDCFVSHADWRGLYSASRDASPPMVRRTG